MTTCAGISLRCGTLPRHHAGDALPDGELEVFEILVQRGAAFVPVLDRHVSEWLPVQEDPPRGGV
jgi:hypothetical protein